MACFHEAPSFQYKFCTLQLKETQGFNQGALTIPSTPVDDHEFWSQVFDLPTTASIQQCVCKSFGQELIPKEGIFLSCAIEKNRE